MLAASGMEEAVPLVPEAAAPVPLPAAVPPLVVAPPLVVVLAVPVVEPLPVVEPVALAADPVRSASHSAFS